MSELITKQPADAEHSDLMGGSSAAKRIHCPGSYALEQGLPNEESEHAARGTALHQCIEHYLIHRDGEDPDVLVGMDFYGWTMTQELIDEKIKPALAALDEIIADAGGDMEFLVEVKASLDAVIPGAFGTIDILGKGANGKLYVIDWKFGDGVPVSPESNYQCGFYGAAAMYDDSDDVKQLVWGEGDRDKLLHVSFVIVQPRVGYPDEPDWQKWETTDEWVEQFLDQAVQAYDKIQKPNAPLNEGSWCRWCAANMAGVCPLKTKGLAVVADNTVKPSQMDEIQLAAFLEACDNAEAIIKNVRAFAHGEAERGVKIPGWKLVNKRASRRYNDAAAAEAKLRKMAGVKVGDIMQQTLKTPAQLEKALGKKKYETFAKDHVSMVSSGTTLARDTDNRPDVSDPSKTLAKKLQATLDQQGHTLPGEQAKS